MFKKKWIRWAGLLIILGLVWGLYLYTKPVGKTGRLKPDYSLTAVQLFDEFSENESTAGETYLNKVIAVSGTVSEVELNQDQGISVRLKSSHPVFGVLCELESDGEESDLQAGNEITLKGICTGKLMDVVMVRCVEM